MIRIIRSICPPSLEGSPQRGTHYNKPDVIVALSEMQHNKCCYCETNLPVEGRGKEVEHFRPRSKFTSLINKWSNLLLVCPQCNGKKREQFPRGPDGNPLIIDPSDPNIDPEEHITFTVDLDLMISGLIGQAIPRNDSQLGKVTIDVTGIGLPYFTSERAKYFFARILLPLQNLCEAKLYGEEQLMQSSRTQFELLMSAKSNFAAFARAFAREFELDEKFGVTIPD